jgi:hypothetical protein
MPLIHCPECGIEISDKVKTCPHCGYPFDSLTENNDEMQKVEISSVRLHQKNPEKTKKILMGIGTLVIVAILATIVILFVNYQNQKKAFNSYIDNLTEISMIMLTGGAKAEELNNLTAKVWRNSIYEESDPETDEFTKDSRGIFYDDFNDALSSLYFDNSTQESISEIEKNQELVQLMMKDLQNPPDDLENCYETVTDLYTAYRSLTDLAINPSGSLQSFSEAKNEKVDTFLDLFKRLESQIPDKKE